MDKNYLQKRRGNNQISYHLEERTEIISSSLSELVKSPVNSILDVGTADGKMLNSIACGFNIKQAVGIDNSTEAIDFARETSDIDLSKANLFYLPFKDNAFDILLACAVFEHIKDIDSALIESRRVLKNKGLLFVTLPNPFFDWINSSLFTTYHLRRYRLNEFVRYMESNGFRVIKTKHFMLCPFGHVPLEKYLEKVIRFMKLDFMLFNQLIIGLKQID